VGVDLRGMQADLPDPEEAELYCVLSQDEDTRAAHNARLLAIRLRKIVDKLESADVPPEEKAELRKLVWRVTAVFHPSPRTRTEHDAEWREQILGECEVGVQWVRQGESLDLVTDWIASQTGTDHARDELRAYIQGKAANRGGRGKTTKNEQSVTALRRALLKRLSLAAEDATIQKRRARTANRR
jgi:hypothetical protein